MYKVFVGSKEAKCFQPSKASTDMSAVCWDGYETRERYMKCLLSVRTLIIAHNLKNCFGKKSRFQHFHFHKKSIHFHFYKNRICMMKLSFGDLRSSSHFDTSRARYVRGAFRSRCESGEFESQESNKSHQKIKTIGAVEHNQKTSLLVVLC